MKEIMNKVRVEASVFEDEFAEFRKGLDIMSKSKANDVYYKEDVINELDELIKRLEGMKKLAEEA